MEAGNLGTREQEVEIKGKTGPRGVTEPNADRVSGILPARRCDEPT